jgi:hypothetical protein
MPRSAAAWIFQQWKMPSKIQQPTIVKLRKTSKTEIETVIGECLHLSSMVNRFFGQDRIDTLRWRLDKLGLRR